MYVLLYFLIECFKYALKFVKSLFEYNETIELKEALKNLYMFSLKLTKTYKDFSELLESKS